MKRAESREDHTHWKWPGGRGDGGRREKWALEDETGEIRGQQVSLSHLAVTFSLTKGFNGFAFL